MLKRPRPLSLSLRVMLFVMVAIGLSLLLMSSLVLSTVERHFIEQDTDELRSMVEAVEHALLDLNEDYTALPVLLASAVAGHHGVFYEVRNAQGESLFRSNAFDFTSVTATLTPQEVIDLTSTYLWHVGDSVYRGVFTLRQVEGVDYQIISAIDMEFHREFLESFQDSLWLILLAAGAITLFAAWVGVYQGLRPLRGVSDSVRAVQTNKLDTRLDIDSVPVELQDLVHSFNQMIEQLELGFSKLSHFSDDIAHELRTPLTNMITQTQVGLSKARSDADYRELLYSVLEEQERLTKMVNDMLWLAKTENGLVKLSTAPINIHDEFLSLFDFFDALAEERQITLNINAHNSLVLGDRDLLRRAFSNLLANAIAHSPKQSEINVSLHDEGGDCIIVVQNQGQDIAPEHWARIFERFYRVDPSRQRHAEGAGLGLAIVKTVMEAHAGAINVESGKGSTRFIVRLAKA